MSDAPTVYSYSPENGEFTGSAPARLSPAWTDKDPPGEQYLTPAWATLIEAPAAPEGQAAVFANGAWSLVEDHRGSVWYDADGKQIIIDALGPVPEGLTVDPPSANDN